MNTCQNGTIEPYLKLSNSSSYLFLSPKGNPAGISQFYIGSGFATIRNFTQGQDRIQLAGYDLEQFLIVPINNNRDLAIQTNGFPTDFQNGVTQVSRFDTIAVIEGGGNLKLNLLPESPFATLLIG